MIAWLILVPFCTSLINVLYRNITFKFCFIYSHCLWKKIHLPLVTLQMKTEITVSLQVTVGQLYLFPETAVLVFQMSALSILETVWFNYHERCFEYSLNSCCKQNAAEGYRIPFYSVGQEIKKILIMKPWSLFLLSHPALSSVQSLLSLSPVGWWISTMLLFSLLLTWGICQVEHANTLYFRLSNLNFGSVLQHLRHFWCLWCRTLQIPTAGFGPAMF